MNTGCVALLLAGILAIGAMPVWAQEEPTVKRAESVPEPVDPPAPSNEAMTLLPGPANWRGERIALPPEFAPELPFTGVEELRFSPGMYDPQASDFFSYLFAFALEQDRVLDKASIERLLLHYYRGLCQTVAEGNEFDCPAEAVTLTLTPVVGGYLGELQWIEPFVTGQSQTLYLELLPGHGEQAYLYGAASPKDLQDDQWQNLRRYLHLPDEP
ncbi:hypothetical protein [Ferrimonas balearica]|uniref:hypothetical protein n=1 Tax=Ferrimonas balearica TaxID=44012 RepID=UPI001C99A1BC|nr:hypothetical protein [Ferrimonas balearica]MBY5993004.1 hypothetical protein [Ferrimonas balearica]